MTNPRTRPMTEISPSVESVTWPGKTLAYFCAKLSAPLTVVVQQQLIFRSREQVARFFAGTDLLAPGLVWVGEWRPEPGSAGETARSSQWGGVGRKR